MNKQNIKSPHPPYVFVSDAYFTYTYQSTFTSRLFFLYIPLGSIYGTRKSARTTRADLATFKSTLTVSKIASSLGKFTREYIYTQARGSTREQRCLGESPLRWNLNCRSSVWDYFGPTCIEFPREKRIFRLSVAIFQCSKELLRVRGAFRRPTQSIFKIKSLNGGVLIQFFLPQSWFANIWNSELSSYIHP